MITSRLALITEWAKEWKYYVLIIEDTLCDQCASHILANWVTPTVCAGVYTLVTLMLCVNGYLYTWPFLCQSTSVFLVCVLSTTCPNMCLPMPNMQFTCFEMSRGSIQVPAFVSREKHGMKVILCDIGCWSLFIKILSPAFCYYFLFDFGSLGCSILTINDAITACYGVLQQTAGARLICETICSDNKRVAQQRWRLV